MEQRNGRIDRKLQPNDEVFCHYFVYQQRPEDKILTALVGKTERIKEELGSLSQVIETQIHKKLAHGIRRNSINELEDAIKKADIDDEQRTSIQEELDASRKRKEELQTEISYLEGLLKESKKSINFDKDHFRSAISCALELVSGETLVPLTDHPDSTPMERFAFPAIDQRADQTWTNTIDTLRTPRNKDEKPWDWRRRAVVRPIVFDEPDTVNEDVVHVHLEHRVVQRLLSRFICQGFIYHDLSRACFTQTKDNIPRVILIGRLCLYGNGAARLHEELVPITARWTPPETRKQPLVPYSSKDAESKTLELLEQSLLLDTTYGVDPEAVVQLQMAASQDVRELLQYLEQRGDEFAQIAKDKLQKRAEAESKAMREILETQKKHIESTITKYDKEGPVQLRIKFIEDELKQLEANRKYWDKRLQFLESELEIEPKRVREVYEVKAKRVEPVGLIYLWPAQQG